MLRSTIKATTAALLMISAVMLTNPATVKAQDSSVSVEASLDFYNIYLWRGLLLTDDPVFQPYVGVSFEAGPVTITPNIWGNMDLGDANDNEGEFNEIDYAIDFSGDISDTVSYSAGALWYTFPDTDFDDTLELYVGLYFGVPLNPGVTLYWDVIEAEGVRIQFDVGESIPLVEDDSMAVSLDLGASIAIGDQNFNEFYYGTDDAAFTDFSLSAGLPIAFGDNLSITPTITQSWLVDSDISDASDDSANFLYGVSVGLAF